MLGALWFYNSWWTFVILAHGRKPMLLGIKPTVDFAFKKIFGSPENVPVLIGLLNAILRLANPIVHVEILNPFSYQEFAEDKLIVLDIRARDAAGSRPGPKSGSCSWSSCSRTRWPQPAEPAAWTTPRWCCWSGRRKGEAVVSCRLSVLSLAPRPTAQDPLVAVGL